MENTLITGATGFVGRALCIKLIKDRWPIRRAIRSLEEKDGLSDKVKTASIEQ